MHKYRVKVWRDRLDHTLPVEHLVVVQDLTFPEFEDMIQGFIEGKTFDMWEMLGPKHLPITLTEILTISAAELQLVGVAGILKIVVAPKPNNNGWNKNNNVKCIL